MAATDSSEQQLRFRWNDHPQHLSKVLTLQRVQERYCDITLVSEDGFITKAHQAVLVSCSSYFERVLGEVRQDQHPMVVLRGANLQQLTCLLDFMYQGNLQVDQHLIEPVLEVADLLGVKGLAGIRSNPTIQKFMATPTTTTNTTTDPTPATNANINPTAATNVTNPTPATTCLQDLPPTTTASIAPQDATIENEAARQTLLDTQTNAQTDVLTDTLTDAHTDAHTDIQTSGIDLSMAKNEPRSPKDAQGVTQVTQEATEAVTSLVTCGQEVMPSEVTEATAGVAEVTGREGEEQPPPALPSCWKRRRLDSPSSEDILDPDWGRIGPKVDQCPPRPSTAADLLPRTITLTAISSAAAASSGAGPRVERSVEVPCEAGPLTITVTTGPDAPQAAPRPVTRRRALLPPASPSPPAAAALRRARRRLRARRGEEGRRRWVARDRHCLDSGGTAERPATRLRRRSTAPRPTPAAPCDLPFPAAARPVGDALQGVACVAQAPDHHQYCPQQQQQQQHHQQQHQQHQHQHQQVVQQAVGHAQLQQQGEGAAVGQGVGQGVGECEVEEGGDEAFPAVSPLALFSLPPPRPRAKQRRTTLTLEQKVKVVEAFLEGKSQRQIAGLYGTGKTQVSGIIRRREEVLAAYRDSLLRGERLTAQRRKRRGGYARLNQHLIQWYRHAVGAGGARVTAGMLRAKALQLAPQLGYHDFKASNGWLATFKANHNLKFSRPGRAAPPPAAPLHHNDTDEDLTPARRPAPVPGAFVEEGEAEGSCGGPAPQRPETEDELGPARQTLDPCESPADPSDPAGLLHPGLSGAGLAKPPQMVNSIGANLSAAYNLSRDLGRELNRGEAGPDLSVMSASPLGHPAALGRGVEGPVKAPEGPLSAYKSEEPLPYAYDPQNRMAEAAPPRPAEYNYAPYGFPGGYYGYHFLGQY